MNTRLTGLVIRVAGISRVERPHQVSGAQHEFDGFRGMLDSLLGSNAAPAALRTQAQAARVVLADVG